MRKYKLKTLDDDLDNQFLMPKKNGKIIFSRIFLPQNLDLSLFDEFRIEYRKKLLIIISTIYWRQICCKQNKKYNGFISFSRKSQSQLIGKNFIVRVRYDLVRMGIIEVQDLEKRDFGQYLLGYKLTEKYYYEKVKNIITAKEKEYILKDIELAINDIMSKTKITFNQEYLLKCLDNSSIDESNASAKLEEDYKEQVGAINHAYNCNLISIGSIADKQWYFNVSKNTGRVFTNITNLKSEYRKFLSYKGNPLVEVDISNCQPLLLHTLYLDKTTPESIRYKEIVESGQFNERIGSLCGVEFETQEDRKDFKISLLTQLFMKEEWDAPYRDLFYQTFPELAIQIKCIKKPTYKAIARCLQNLESDLIINNVITICREQNIPILTIHDSIMTTVEYKDKISFIIIDECQKLYGLKPNLK